jgi:carbon-monoxide dehydrogenase medium subunit
VKPAAFDHHRPADLVAAIRLLKDPDLDTKVIAGGQSLGPMLNLRLTRPERLVEISNAGPMREISETATHVSFGAATRHAEIEDRLTPDPSRGMMPFVASGIAYRAVRNKGTIGGSICHADPAADWVTAMTALDATIVITSNGEDTRTVPMTGFMQGAYRTSLAAGEIVTAVQVPRYSDRMAWGYYKIFRKVGEFSDAIAAWVADPASRYSRVVFGAGAGAPLVSERLAELLAKTGAVPDLATIKDELAVLAPDLDAVKQHLFAVALQRCVTEALRDE